MPKAERAKGGGGDTKRGPKASQAGAGAGAGAAAQPEGLSSGGFEDRRKYRLDEDAAAYFKEIAEVLKKTEDAEQRQLLVSNALGESLGAPAIRSAVARYPARLPRE